MASESTRIYLLSHNTHTINNAAKLKHVQVHLAPRARGELLFADVLALLLALGADVEVQVRAL